MLQMTILKLLNFLAQDGPRAKKHTSSWLHPICTVILHYVIITTFIFFVHDLTIVNMITNPIAPVVAAEKEIIKKQISKFTFLYFILLITYRIYITKKLSKHHTFSSSSFTSNTHKEKGVVYEITWLCNSTLFMGSLGLWTKRDAIVLAHVVAVSIDQVLWYVDLSVFFLSGFKRFPIGVAKYLTWPKTTWAERITCTHHLWTIPLLMYACNGFQYHNPLHVYVLSFFIIIVNVSLSRFLTPFVLDSLSTKKMIKDDRCNMSSGARNGTSNSSYDNKKEDNDIKYLNVNLSHELWKDIKFEALQIQRDDPPVFLYLFRLLWRWQVFNGIVLVMVLYPLSLIFYH